MENEANEVEVNGNIAEVVVVDHADLDRAIDWANNHPAKESNLEETVQHIERKARRYEKTAHLFAHRKQGVQKRFEKVYMDLKDKVQSAWASDLLKMEAEFKLISKSNQALASTKIERTKKMAEQTAKSTLRTVFNEWRAEINRIISDLNGYPQEDGNILFPDGSVARMPKGLYVAPEHQLRFE